MIELKDVSKHWNQPVFERVNLKIPKGDFLYLVGDSGSGKTTLLKLIVGELKPNQGQVLLFGKNTNQFSHVEQQLIRQKMGIIFQDLRLIDDLSVMDNIRLSLELIDGKKLQQTQKERMIRDCIQILNLGKVSEKKVIDLSGGEKQKTAIARAIVRQPEILIADEPTAGLDRDQAFLVMDLFQKLNYRGATVLLATHDREMVRRFRHRSCILKSGKVMAEEGISLI